MTNYHPDVQRAYDAHCADGYVFPDDETGPQEAAGGAVRDFPCCEAPGDGEAAERRTAGQSVIERAIAIIRPILGPWYDGKAAQSAFALADAGLLADPEHEHVHRLVEGVREGDGWTVQLGGALIAKCDTYGKTAMHGDLDRARGALDETLDDLTRTLARAEKAEAEVVRYQRLVSWHEWHGSDAEARARRAEDWQREVCDMLGYEPDGADEVLTYLPAWRAESSAKDEEIARLRQPSGVWRCSNSHAERAEKAEAERDRVRDTAAALEVEVARLSGQVERVRQTRAEWDSGHLPIHWRGFAADIDRALSDTTGEAAR